MNKLNALKLAALITCIAAGSTQAQTKTEKPKSPMTTVNTVSKEANATAKTLFPDSMVKPGPGGLTEVDAKVYISTDGRTVIVGGRIVDPTVMLIGARQAQPAVAQPQPPAQPPIAKIDYKSLPINNSITVVKGDGSRKFSVFTDLDCPYCKQLEITLKDITNYTMQVYLMPIAQLHPEAHTKSEAVWCSGGNSERAAAYSNWWNTGRVPTSTTCDTPIKAIYDVAAKLNIRGTPTLIREDGSLVPGAIPKQQLDLWLSGT